MKRNPNISQLQSNYLFPEITLRKQRFLAAHPNASLISLGIGDTTEPVPPSITHSLMKTAAKLGTSSGYSGYGPEQGQQILRERIAEKIYAHLVNAEEVFVSDGAKCDLGRLQLLFGSQVSIAVQNPSYPVYIEGSLIHGVKKIIPLLCSPENNFFPDLKTAPRTDLIYFCSPNNPTGAVATKEQLTSLVEFAASNRSIILYDAAYANYIQDPTLPKSIYEIKGAREVAIEIGSFSKLVGFTGVRLGWSVVPEELLFDDGTPVKSDWKRLITTIFNGASNIAQAGGSAALEEAGLKEIASLNQFYLENAHIIKTSLEGLGNTVYGGGNAPYLWVRFKGKNSWDSFQHFLNKYHIITTPGSGFGSSGEEYLRFTAFGHRKTILEAAARLSEGTT